MFEGRADRPASQPHEARPVVGRRLARRTGAALIGVRISWLLGARLRLLDRSACRSRSDFRMLVMLRVNSRQARGSELILLSEAELRIVRTEPSGRRWEKVLPAHSGCRWRHCRNATDARAGAAAQSLRYQRRDRPRTRRERRNAIWPPANDGRALHTGPQPGAFAQPAVAGVVACRAPSADMILRR